MNEFEQIASEESGDCEYQMSSEYAIEWVRGDKNAVVTFPTGRFNNRVRKLAEEHPEDVKIKRTNQDGSIVAVIPVKYIKISAPPQFSEEYIEERRERMRGLREKQIAEGVHIGMSNPKK